MESAVRGISRPALQGSLSLPGLRPAGELERPRNRLGAVSCRAPQPSSRLSTGWVQVLRQWCTSLAISVSATSEQRQSAWVIDCGSWPPPFGWPEEQRASWVGYLAPSVMTAGQDLGT